MGERNSLVNIDVLSQLLSARYPGALAYSKGGVGGAKKSAVCVRFTPTGRLYEYQMSVYRVAEKLDLIPTYDIPAESNRILAALANGQSYVSTPGASDTVRHYGIERGIITVDQDRPWVSNLVMDNYSKDQYDREVCTYSLK